MNSETNDFSVESEIERLNYLITASEENTSCFVVILDDNKQELYSFNSTMFLTDQEDLELVWENPHDIALELIKKNNVVKIEFDLHGIKTYAECFVRSVKQNIIQIILNISGPYKMERFQRRKGQRVSLSSNFSATISLDKNKDYLTDLLVLNISDGGAAILVNAPPEHIRKNLTYEFAEINLPLKMNNYFFVPMKICHVKPISKSLLPAIYREKVVANPWTQVGIKFMSVTPKLEHSLAMVINQILRNK